ncbi:beta-galactosidase [Actinacidiphila alni]|uniref:Beta-galactosidase n=1 Tax=Actinacidiphila alni TaxID=380248 RepID=A0A1I2IEF8_9ACTN|nr:beta-galactosidase [Actinacidiphila alni]SFF40695.1 beta-galactosidase [Actinacidiphila alni]
MSQPVHPDSPWGRVPRLAYGADHNPEQWDPQVWRDDVRLMRAAGVTLVSLGIFAWSWLEPEQDRFDFDGLDEVIGLLHAGGVAVDLATPTAAPPLWFARAHPESLPVTADGLRLAPGSRQSFCASSPAYRERAALITSRLAERYGGHPAVVMWHIGNEYGNTNAHCWCETSAAAFRHWLHAKYGDLDTLNSRWGTAFWGQRYSDWAQVAPPRTSAGSLNPALRLDFLRFCDAEQLACYRAERDIVRAHSPGRPVTTNFMTGNFAWADYWTWAAEVDVVANDHYLTAADPHRTAELAFAADLTRGLAAGRPWLLMEHSTSAVQWQPRNTAKAPGELRRNSLTHVARGADGALFFQWRQSASGAEMWHSAMVPHGGEDTRVHREVKRLGAEIGALAEVAGSVCEPAEVAVVWDYDAWWALELPDRPSIDMTYRDEIRAWHRALWSAGAACDVVPATATADELARYKLLLAPSHYAATRETAAAWEAYAAAGGHLVVGPFSGVVDHDDRVHPGPYPGVLRGLLGLRVDEFLPLAAGEKVALGDGSTGRVWAERVLPDSGTRVEARFATGPASGGPAVLRADRGAGAVRYCATRFTDDSLRRLLTDWRAAAGCAPPPPGAGDGVETVRRRSPGGASWLFVVNHTSAPVAVPCTGRDLLTGVRADGVVTVAAGDVAVVRES